MKKFTRILCIVLALTLPLTAALAGCKKKKKTEEENNQPENTVRFTEHDLVKNGGTAYKVVLPEDAVYYETFAADELVNFVYEATGATLGRTTEEEATYSADAKLIILGDTAFGAHSGKEVSAVPEQGFTLKTVDTNLFILGRDLGVLYGVYEFLAQNLGFEVYAADEIALERNVKDKKLIDADYSDAPDILFRTPNFGSTDSVLTANRMRMTRDIWMTRNANFVHNSFGEYLPYNTYFEDHEEWYSLPDATQLCYTAQGNAEELSAMQDAVLARMQNIINYFFEQGDFRGSLSFTHEDNNDWCTCTACTALKNEYGAESVTLIHFINPVARRLKEWLAETWPGHEVNIAVFAYLKTETAPVKKEGGKYVPVDDSVYLEDNVALFYAPYNANYYYGFDAEPNATFRETLDKWMAISKKLYLWTYNVNFRDYLGWFDSFNGMQSIYRMARDNNAIYFFDQGKYNTSALTGFDHLKAYLSAKLYWDADADFNALIDGFFENYFKDAAEPMRAYFDSFRAWAEYIKTELGASGRCNTSIYKAEHWPKQVLNLWMGYIDQAYAAIEPLRGTDPQLYAKLYDRILSESIANRFHLIEFHASTYEAGELLAMKKAFKADADRLGFTLYTEYGSLASTAYEKWGIA